MTPQEYYLLQFGTPIGFICGLDLGMARDYSAIVVSEKRTPDGRDIFHVVRWAHRFKLGTKYADVAREVAGIMAQLPARPEPARLFADSTGVGKPVCDQLREEGLHPYDCTLTGGSQWAWNGRNISLPKSLLVSTLNVCLQNEMLILPGELPFLDQIIRELEAFRMTRTDTGHDAFNARSEADHDDFVISLGLAVWGGERNLSVRSGLIL